MGNDKSLSAPLPVTLQLLRAVADIGEARFLDLYREVVRINAGRAHAVSELLALSVKISTRGCFSHRYDSPIHWTAEEGARFYESVQRAAPTEAVARLLALPDNPVRHWLERSARFFSYLAAEHDNRVYKIYLFRTDGGPFLQDFDLRAESAGIYEGAYIDCLEINLDRPERLANPVYFKLRANGFAEVLAEGYRPHAQLCPQVLADVPDRTGLVAGLERLLDGVGRVNDPVIKLRWPGRAARLDAAGLERLDYGISTNVFDEDHLRWIDGRQAEIEAIGAALGCRAAVMRWLETVRAFPCFLTYVCVGRDFVTLYYKCTADLKRRPVPAVPEAGAWAPVAPAPPL